ncbi:guanylate kinase [Bryocella elongata]|uniref:Guanylate kinase n=1 Tax=Bryocella elongata TaxID=863522 RepID=A0A1H5Z8P8_9BACT|nr:guanylate kinase [Bryocella elongata]SEG32899.1 guanylate kinase [Bryocella elongata]
MAGLLFIISAPSGSGKSTLVSEVRRLVSGLEFSVSYTTRAPRGSEEDGKEYHFITRERFEQMIAADEFLEWAQVFGKDYYGTARAALTHAGEQGHDLLLDIDVQGALQVMEKMPEAVSIFILPPSPQVLELRLRNRSQAEGVTEEEVIERRLNQARTELSRIERYRYALVNDVLDQAASEMRSIVLTSRNEASEEEEQLSLACKTSAGSPRLASSLASFGVSLGD